MAAEPCAARRPGAIAGVRHCPCPAPGVREAASPKEPEHGGFAAARSAPSLPPFTANCEVPQVNNLPLVHVEGVPVVLLKKQTGK